MIVKIKELIWNVIKRKEVSLVLIFNDEGDILWHRGRAVIGRNIKQGGGYSRSIIKQAIAERREIREDNFVITVSEENLPESAAILNIQNLIVLPVREKYFLYVDSGTTSGFSDREIGFFQAMGELLGLVIDDIRQDENRAYGFSGTSETAQKVRETIIKFSVEDLPILLMGETGTGKNHIAELIHQYSGCKGPLVTVHTPELSENLFKSETFGHKKGAFTGADQEGFGFVKEAEGGILFFDEISEVSLSVQSKLLRFIETKRFRRVGEAIERRANVRIIASTNRDLKKEISKNQFRKDLYYRLSVLSIVIPPLRDRKEDIQALVRDNYGLLKGKTLDHKAWNALMQYHWPGNVRQLLHVLNRAQVMTVGDTIGPEISDYIEMDGDEAAVPSFAESRLEYFWDQIAANKSFWDVVWQPFIKERALNKYEVREIIKRASTQCQGSIKKTAQFLGIGPDDYKKFVAYLHKYDIHPHRNPLSNPA